MARGRPLLGGGIRGCRRYVETHLARGGGSLLVTDRIVRIGAVTVARDQILGVDPHVDEWSPGRSQEVGRRRGRGRGRGRGRASLILLLADGDRIAVRARRPDRLTAALQFEAPTPVVRRAREADLPAVLDIAAHVGALGREAGYPAVDVRLAEQGLHEAIAVFVVGEPPYGFVQLAEIDGMAQIGALAVTPGERSSSAGNALLAVARAWAKDRGFPAIVVTTFAAAPWNAPFYAAHGFSVMEELPPGLAELRQWECLAGLDSVGARVTMRRELA